jgi:hypothetical protein
VKTLLGTSDYLKRKGRKDDVDNGNEEEARYRSYGNL